MAHTFTMLKYHVIFSTTDEQPLLTPDLQEWLFGYVKRMLTGRDRRLISIGGTADHLHLLLGIQPTVAVSRVVSSVKAVSSKHLSYRTGSFAWQPGYCVFSVSESEVPAVDNYIRRQELWHKTKPFKEEKQRFLEIHGLEARDEMGKYTQNTFHWIRHHIVFSTKNRHWLIEPEMEKELHSDIEHGVLQEGGELVEIGGMPDHLHVLVSMKPVQTLSKMAQSIKGRSSRLWCRQHASCLSWQAGYGGFTVSKSQMNAACNYIRQQKEHHRTVSYADEFRDLLNQHNLKVKDGTVSYQ